MNVSNLNNTDNGIHPNMQPFLKRTENPEAVKKLLSVKRNYGMLYGAVAGLAFASVTWGIDDYFLSQAHALYPWLKFIIGSIICICVGALAGRLSAQFEKVSASVLIWLVPLVSFAWLSLAIPFKLAPALIVWLKPDIKYLLNYAYFPDFQYRFGLSLILALVFGLLVGLLQPMMTESAVFSNSSAGKFVPLIICTILMGLSGFWIDNFNNEPLRSAVTSLDATIQYAREHQGQQIDPQVDRRLHLSIVESFAELIDRPRHLIVSSYNSTLGQINILVEFDNIPVNCVVIYAQPAFCERVAPLTP